MSESKRTMEWVRVCARCGSDEVQVLEWVCPKSRTIEDSSDTYVTEDSDPVYTWCDVCDENGEDDAGHQGVRVVERRIVPAAGTAAPDSNGGTQ